MPNSDNGKERNATDEEKSEGAIFSDTDKGEEGMINITKTTVKEQRYM